MQQKAPPSPDPLIEAIPDPETIRDWIYESVRRTTVLRSLLRTSVTRSRFSGSQTPSTSVREKARA